MTESVSAHNWIVPIRSFKFIGMISLFIAIGLLIALHISDSFDYESATFFHNIQSANLDGLMIAITVTGDLTVTFTAGVILTIMRRTRKLGLSILIAIVAISVLLMCLKPIFARPLPPYEFVPHIQLPDKFTLEKDVLSFTNVPYSFPSGHETRAAALALLTGFYLVRRHGERVHLVWLYPILVGISRLYLSAHYPFDIFGSAVLGIVVATIIARILKLDKIQTMADDRFSNSSSLKTRGRKKQ